VKPLLGLRVTLDAINLTNDAIRIHVDLKGG